MMNFYIFTVLYFLISACFIYPTIEFVSAGLTIKDLFSSWLGNENEFFVQYHIKRSIATLFVHSMLPFGYLLGLILFGNMEAAQIFLGKENPFWPTLAACSLIGPIYALFKVIVWSKNNWSSHPIAECLAVYCNNNTSWMSVASDINIEYRRIDKIMIDTNSVTRIVATDNWIIKISPYKLQIAHQSDTALIVNKSDTHVMSPTTGGEVQFVNIEVKPTRSGAQSFNIRLNALDFKDLQDKVLRPITVLENVTFHRTVLDRFIDTFKEEVAKNPYYETNQELEQCIGCMQTTANVKLNKSCNIISEEFGPDACVTCYCRPMWCIECMAKWFASRQNENVTETWLSSKCTCPVCRAKFCLLDVCLVRTRNS